MSHFGHPPARSDAEIEAVFDEITARVDSPARAGLRCSRLGDHLAYMDPGTRIVLTEPAARASRRFRRSTHCPPHRPVRHPAIVTAEVR